MAGARDLSGKAWAAVCLLALSLLSGNAQQTAPFSGVQQRLDTRFLATRGLTASSQIAQSATASAAVSTPTPRVASAFSAMIAARHVQAAALQPQAVTGSTTTWQSAGPSQVQTAQWGLITGRISSLAVDPNDTSGNTVYVGATGGGVWKSSNAASSNPAAVTFTPLTDDISVFANSFQSVPSLSIGAIAVSPVNSQLILAGTGDPNDALDSYYGVGILRSTNGGQTWSLIRNSVDPQDYNFAGLGFAGFAWSTSNTSLVVAAASVSREGMLIDDYDGASSSLYSPMAGLYYSSDAGITWHLATVMDSAAGVIQSANKLTQPPGNAATSVVWDPQRALFVAAVRFHGYYSSPDGVTWTRLANQPGTGLSLNACPSNPNLSGNPSCPLFRGALAVQPVTGDIFALTTDLNNVDRGLYQDQCSANGLAVSSCASNTIAFGKQITDTALDDPTNPGVIDQADYNFALSAIPSQQDTLLFAGTEDIYRCSLANSCAWRNTTNVQTCSAAKVAPEIHAIASAGSSGSAIFFGNDGGLWRSTDGVAQTGGLCASTDPSHFDNLNSGLGSLAELTDVAVAPNNPSLVLAGMGEFGTITSSGASSSGVWMQLLNGEGSFTAIDPASPANWYAGNGPSVNIQRCVNGANCSTSDFGGTPVIGASQVDHDADYEFQPAPWILDPLNTSNIFLGTCRIWLGPADGGWSSGNAISASLDGSGNNPCNGDPIIGALGAGGSYNSPTGGEVVYVGMAGPQTGGSTLAGHVFKGVVPQGASNSSNIAWTDLWKNPVSNGSTTQFNPLQYGISTAVVDSLDTTGNRVYIGIAGFVVGSSGGNLYGSADGGADWINITNTLPPSPVTSVVIDPSNAQIVYVGGDFGVYWTNNIQNCVTSSQNCWAQLGAGLPNAPVTKLAIFPSVNGNILEAATYGRGLWTIGLTTSTATAQATLTPTSVSFNAAGVGTKSTTTATLTLKSSGNAALAIGSISVLPTSDYAQTNTCGTSLSAGSSCTISVTFTPSAVGDRTGTLTVTSNATNGPQYSTLDGTGLTPGNITLSPSALNFPLTAEGAQSASQNVNVLNSGGAPVAIDGTSLAGPQAGNFTLPGGGNCGSSLAAGASCVVPVVFSPLNTGALTAQFQLAATAANSPFAITLNGTGAMPPRVVLSPSSLTFATTAIGSISASQAITVSNTGGVPAQLGTGYTSSEYTVTANNCGSQLAASATCTVDIAFAPQGTGSRAGLFTLPSSSMPAGQVTAPLSGSGVPAPVLQITPGSASFGNTPVGTKSASQLLSITNTGGSAATLGTPSTGAAAFAVTSNTCPSSLAVNASCSIGVLFQPTSTGTQSSTFTLPFGSGSATAQLSGTGTPPAQIVFNPASVNFGAVAEDTASAPQTVTLSNPGTATASISGIGISGSFSVASGGTCGTGAQSLGPGASCALNLVFSPPSVGADSGSLTVSGTFSNAPAALSLSGQGATPPSATASPANLVFPDTAQGSASPAQSIAIASSGGVPLTLGTPSVSSNFQVSGNTCPASLAPGNTCTVSVLFHPSTVGAANGTLSLPNNSATSPLNVQLSGNGLQPGALTLTPSDLEFGQAALHSTNGPQLVTLKNTGGASVNPGTLAVTGDYALSPANPCPSSLAAGASCSIGVTFTPSASGPRAGQLTVPGDGSTPSAVSTLNGTGVLPGQLAFSPTSLAYGVVGVGGSLSETVSVTNTGGFAVHLTSLSANGDFTVSGGSCGAGTTLAASSAGSCTVVVTFSPSTTGTRTGMLTLANDGATNPATLPLAGVGAQSGTLSLTPSSHDFGSVVIGASGSSSFTASNGGGVPVSLQSFTVSGAGYSLIGNNCSSTLAAGASCTLQVQFLPGSSGSTGGSLQITGQSANSTTTLSATSSLSGTGVTPGALTLSPGSVDFGTVVTGASSTAQISVSSTGGAAVTLGAPFASSGFSVTSNCPPSLAPGASCSLAATFQPTAAGSFAGLLTLPASVPGGAATDALSGTSVAPGSLNAAPASLAFAAIEISASDPSQTIVLTNPGGVAVALAPPSVSSADFAITANTCGTSLAAGGSCTVSVNFTPSAAGSRTAVLTLAGSIAGGPAAHVALNGTGLAHAALLWTPSSLTFASQQLRTTSPAQSLTLANTGGVSTSLGLPVLTGPFQITSNSCASVLAAGAQCSISVLFVPVQGGASQGSLKLSAGSGTPSATATLSGTGQSVVLNPLSLTFAALPIGQTSPPQAMAVENLGQSPIPLSSVSITGDFASNASSCGNALPADTTCALFLTFTPTASGQRTGTFSVNDGTETRTAALLGTGLSPATDNLSGNALNFPLTELGKVSAEQSITVNNTGDATLTGISTSVTGPFVVVNNCAGSLAGHLTCQIAVKYAPTSSGQQTGTLIIVDSLRTQSVALTGQGALPPQAAVAPTSIDFGPYAQGVATNPQAVTLYNNGASPMLDIQPTVSGNGFSIGFSNCTSSLAPGAACQIGIVFTPPAIGPQAGVLTVASSSAGPPLQVSLAGSGEDFTISVIGYSGADVTPGSPATYQLAIAPVGASAGTLTLACTDFPASTTCTPNPQTITVGNQSSGFVTVTIATDTATTTALQKHSREWWLGSGGAASLALVSPFLLRGNRQRRRLLAALGAVLLAGLPLACGVHASGPAAAASTPAGQTPGGTYNIPVIASFPGAQRSVTLKLIVE